MNQSELENLASFNNIRKSCWLRLYWPSEIYSYGKLIREYSNYPKYLPLAVNSDHSGPNFNLLYTDYELSNETFYYLGHNPIKNLEYNKKLQKRKYVTVISPFVYFRRKNNIKYNPNNIGTIAFPVHSDLNVNRDNYFDDYMEDLRRLDSKFHPISICLHQHDILNGNYRIFINKGFDLVTVGNTHDERFAERFYDLICNYKYITSNAPGTITFLALEMNAPFFLYGNSNIKPPLIPKDQLVLNSLFYKLSSMLLLDSENNITKLPSDVISEIEMMLGVNDTISSKELKFILYKALFLWILKGKFLIWLYKRISIYVKH
jgi:hypothetical protein